MKTSNRLEKSINSIFLRLLIQLFFVR